jgi:hypothetical protein
MKILGEFQGVLNVLSNPQAQDQMLSTQHMTPTHMH